MKKPEHKIHILLYSEIKTNINYTRHRFSKLENLVPNPVLNDYGSSQTTQAIPDSTTGSTIDALKEVGNIGVNIAKV